MNKKRKTLYTIIIIILLASIFLLYNSLNGNPISKFIAKGQVKKYLAENYPNSEFYVNSGSYNFKFGEYNFQVTENGTSHGYEFSVRSIIKRDIVDGIYYSNLDKKLMERLSQEAGEEMLELFEKHGISRKQIFGIGVHLEVLQGRLNQDVAWSKDLAIENPLYIHISLNSTQDDKENFFNKAALIKEALDQADYDYERLMFNGNEKTSKDMDKDDIGPLKYSYGLNKEDKLHMKNVEIINQ